MQPNPLVKHFRKPAIYVKLPSKGMYWKEGSIELPVNGEIPIYPMTTKDEIMLRTPDALLNGESTVNTVQSCCPSIKNAWEMPSVDIDYLLIAIRIASYGHELKFDSTCPECKAVSPYAADLRNALEQLAMPDYTQWHKIEDLEFKFRPQNYFEFNNENQAKFAEEQTMRILEDPNLDEKDRSLKLKDSLSNLLNINLQSLSISTEIIKVDGIEVTDKKQIIEYYENSDSKVIREVQKVLSGFAEVMALKPFKIKCDECSFEYSTNFEFDHASFFADGF